MLLSDKDMLCRTGLSTQRTELFLQGKFARLAYAVVIAGREHDGGPFITAYHAQTFVAVLQFFFFLLSAFLNLLKIDPVLMSGVDPVIDCCPAHHSVFRVEILSDRFHASFIAIIIIVRIIFLVVKSYNPSVRYQR